MENEVICGPVGGAVSVFAEYDDATLLWWNVVMENGAAVIVSPDTRIEPVVSVVNDFQEGIPSEHPLRALLTRDLRLRIASLDGDGTTSLKLASQRVQNSSGGNSKLQEIMDEAERKWAKLSDASMKFASANPIYSGDPAVVVGLAAGFEEDGSYTFWNQSQLGFGGYYVNNVFNRYTPNNFVCGCVATVGAALLQYFNVGAAKDLYTKICSSGGTEISLTTKGGVYDWSVLPSDLGGKGSAFRGELTFEQADLLGRVAYDMGVCVQMSYGESGSGAYAVRLVKALRDNFGLADARYINYPSASSFEKLIYAQNRCSAPVILGIEAVTDDGRKGHEVLAVGYGEDRYGSVYTRIFMGYSGMDDAWYALPNVDDYTAVSSIGTMLGMTGETMALCGYVSDVNGNPITGAVITVSKINKSVVSDKNGFWGIRVNPAELDAENEILCTVNGVVQRMSFSVGGEASNKGASVYFSLDGKTELCYRSVESTLCAALPDDIDFVFGEESGIEWKYRTDSDGGIIITGAVQKISGIVTIPTKIGKVPVVAIGGSAFSKCEDLNKIVIPEGVETIGTYAFQGCINLSEVILSSTVVQIGKYAFSKCSNLRTITLPDGIKEINEGLFWEDTALSEIVIPDSVTEIYKYAFMECVGLENMTFGRNLTVIGEKAFYNCLKLKEAIIPEGVMTIGDRAFQGCEVVEKIILPSTLTNVGIYAFSKCYKLKSLVIPEKLRIVSEGICWKDYALSKVETAGTVECIGNAAFRYCTLLENFDFGNVLTNIGKRAFADCDSLKSVKIPHSFVSIGSESFASCGNLKMIYVPDKISDTDIAKLKYGNSANVYRYYLNANGAEVTTDGIPHSWIDDNPELKQLLDEKGGDYEAVVDAKAANGKNTIGECYIAGISPTEADAKFEVSIEIVSGEPMITYMPDLNEGGTKQERVYTIEGCAELGGEWKVIDEDNKDGMRFFKVRVALP